MLHQLSRLAPYTIASCFSKFQWWSSPPPSPNLESGLDRVLDSKLVQQHLLQPLIGKREINQLSVECPNQEKGCQWSGKLTSLNEHSKDCQFRIVPCPNRCTLAGVPVMLLYRDIPVHTTTVCSNRFVNCPHCAKKVKHGDLEAVHFAKCTKIIVPCPNEGCTLRIERAAL